MYSKQISNNNPIICPTNYLRGRGFEKNIKQFSGLCHVFFNSSYLKYFNDYDITLVVDVKSFKIFSLLLDNKNNPVFLAIIRNGAALAAIDFDCLIYLGFTEFVFYGYACSLGRYAIGDIVLLQNTFIGEGVSQFYIGKCILNVATSMTLNYYVKNKLRNYKIDMVNCYTTEALFMETPMLIHHLECQGIECIDMESSALSSIANYRGVDVAFIFCISDAIKNYEWIYNDDIDKRKILINTFFSINE
jgi:purine-nucleoside phosphorylase